MRIEGLSSIHRPKGQTNVKNNQKPPSLHRGNCNSAYTLLISSWIMINWEKREQRTPNPKYKLSHPPPFFLSFFFGLGSLWSSKPSKFKAPVYLFGFLVAIFIHLSFPGFQAIPKSQFIIAIVRFCASLYSQENQFFPRNQKKIKCY